MVRKGINTQYGCYLTIVYMEKMKPVVLDGIFFAYFNALETHSDLLSKGKYIPASFYLNPL